MTPEPTPKKAPSPKPKHVITDEQRQAWATLDAWLNPAQSARLANQGSCEDWAGILELKNRLRPLFAPPTSDL